MAQKSKNTVSSKPQECTLLVEGKDDKDFCEHLLRSILPLDDNKSFLSHIAIIAIGGKDKLANIVDSLFQSSDANVVQKLGILHDADSDYNSVKQKILNIANKHDLAYTDQQGVFNKSQKLGRPAFGYYILPDVGTEGNLETLLYNNVPPDAQQCIENFLSCYPDKSCPINEKVKVRAWYLLQKAWYSNSLSYALQEKIWHPDAPAFQDVKSFLSEFARKPNHVKTE